jgi:hypothetical protein
MAVGFRGSALVNSNTAGTSTVVPMPAGLVVGDRVYVAIGSIATTPTITDPAGWTKLSEYAPGSTLKSALYYRDVVGGEAGTYTWTWSASGRNLGMAVAYSGLDLAATPLGGSIGVTDSAAGLQTPAFATAQAGDWGFFFSMGRENPGTAAAKTWTINDAADEERIDTSSTVGTAGANLTGGWWDSGRELGAGTTVQRTITPSVTLTQFHAWAMRLAAPASTGGPPAGVQTWSYVGQPQR